VSPSIRARLTLWYTAVLTLVLAAAGVGFYGAHSRLRLVPVDEDLADADALVARLLPIELDEGLDLAAAARDALEDVEVVGRPLAVFDTTGARLAGEWGALPLPTGPGGVPDRTVSVRTTGGPFRLRWALHRHGDVAFRVGAARPLAPVEAELAALRRTLLVGSLFALALAAGGGWWIARAALRPLTAMAAQASRITDRTPGQRLAASNPTDELGRLARSFNELLARLELVIARQRRFMADAAHELRSPVSVARAAAEVTLRRDRPEEEYRDGLSVVAAQMRHLARIVEDMFTLARADAASLPLERDLLYLDELVADCVKDARLLAAPKQVEVDRAGPEDIEIRGDERLLRQMLMNLLDNAVRHTPSRGRVRVELRALPEALEVAVADGGDGIPEGDRDRIFERFVRLDESRRPSAGAGLGLPIARTIAEGHGGTLAIERSDGSGSTFVARLPRIPP
jgi:two-component system, OmpR family, sensor kinase